MNEKSEAMRLAAVLDDPRMVVFFEQRCKAAAELRRLYEENAELRRLHAQRDALLKALKRMASIIDKMGDMPDGFIHPSPWQELKCEEALTQARAAIKAVEEGK